jgi:hypothetical protein
MTQRPPDHLESLPRAATGLKRQTDVLGTPARSILERRWLAASPGPFRPLARATARMPTAGSKTAAPKSGGFASENLAGSAAFARGRNPDRSAAVRRSDGGLVRALDHMPGAVGQRHAAAYRDSEKRQQTKGDRFHGISPAVWPTFNLVVSAAPCQSHFSALLRGRAHPASGAPKPPPAGVAITNMSPAATSALAHPGNSSRPPPARSIHCRPQAPGAPPCSPNGATMR